MNRPTRFFKEFQRRMGRDNNIPNNKVEVRWSRLHLSIVEHYFQVAYDTFDFRELPYAYWYGRPELYAKLRRSPPLISAETAASFAQDSRDVFMVPRLNKFRENRNGIKKYQLVEVFISFLLRLLYHKTDSIVNPCKDRINDLEKELRFLQTILVDISSMPCNHEHEQVQNLLQQFEAVANQAGSLVHSLFFSIHRVFVKTDKGLAVFLKHTDLLKANVMDFLDRLPFISNSAYISPKTSVVDSLLIVDSLIYDLEDLMNQEHNQMIPDARDQIKTLHQGIIFLQALIKDTGSPQPSEIGELKEPLMRIGDMAREAEYLTISFLVGDVPLGYLNKRLAYINQKIELVGIELQEITSKDKFGGLKDAKYFSAQLRLQDHKRNLQSNNIIIGFEDEATYILDQLVGGTKHLQFISVFGMPGLGKTTFAKKLYNHPLVNYTFEKLSWCLVSQTYQRRSILADILTHIESEFGKERVLNMEEECLAEHIYKTLKGRRYLIVMDDIWDSDVWDDLRRYFPDDRNGSRILFTTRNKDVAPSNCNNYALPSLTNDQCWELLEKKAFGNQTCPSELIGIGKKIAAYCLGLPLAVVVIAGILSTMDKEKNTWEQVGGNLASYIFDGRDNSLMQILGQSYKHLPEHLKPCFLYFGAFTKEKEIPIRKLMRQWISEGFIHKEEGKSAENVAEEYLMELINKSLVMVSQRRSNGGVKACVLHDLLRDLCLKISEEESFLKFVSDVSLSFCIYDKGPNVRVSCPLAVPSSFCQHTRSFHGYNIDPFYGRDMRLLRVLNCDYSLTIYGIEYLVNLRYLVISCLPKSIGSLVNLEYLHVKDHNLVRLPPDIVQMRKLRGIYVPNGATYDKYCSSSQKNNLEYLSCVWIGEPKDEEMLKCSPHLRKLACKCSPFSSKEKRKIQFANLSFLTQLESLKILLCEYKIEMFSFPSNIKKLTLIGNSLLRLSWGMMSVIGRLENLDVLKLIEIEFEGGIWCTGDGGFQKLTFLKLDQISRLTEWKVASSQHFPTLQQLVLSDCYKLQEIPSEIGEITTLQLIEVKYGCRKSLVESAKQIQQQQLDMGNEDLRVIISVSR